MVVLVSDTSVLIDLERGNLLETAFACGLTMIVPDLLYQRELADHNGPYLRSLGLGVTALSPVGSGSSKGTSRPVSQRLLRAQLRHARRAHPCHG